jgi:group I intron endonuclease
MNSGIYKIVNIVNKKVYIGKASNIYTRFRSHKSYLRRNAHYNNHLQRSWNKYGENSFKFEVIEYCEKDVLIERENYWMKYYNSFDFRYGYNILQPDENNNSYIYPEDIKEIMSEKATIYSDNDLINYLKKYYHENNSVPTTRDLDNDSDYPNSETYRLRFGSFKNALIKSNLYKYIDNENDFDRKEYEKDEVIESLKFFIKSNKKFPDRDDFKNTDYLPSYSTIYRIFGTIKNAKIECGFTKEIELHYEKKKMINDLKILHKRDGYVTSRTIDKCEFARSARYYAKVFGSLMNAFKIAGIQNKRKYEESELNKVG